MLIKHSEETVIEFTLEEIMPMLMDALKRHKKIEWHGGVVPTIRVKKKSSTLNEPDTIEFITTKYNEHNDELTSIDQNNDICIECGLVLTKEYMSNMDADGEIPYYDGDGPYCESCLNWAIERSENE